MLSQLRAAGSQRVHLVSYMGSLQGSKSAVAIRTSLVAACKAAPSELCTSDASATGSGASVTREGEQKTAASLRLKRRSVFCLEPPGYSPPRKSMVDSILCGCIPVFFFRPRQYDRYLPLFMAEWAPNATVRIPPQTKGVDVLRRLAEMPPEAVAAMQATIASHAHRLVYSLGEEPAFPSAFPPLGGAAAEPGGYVGGDALDTLLEALRDLHPRSPVQLP